VKIITVPHPTLRTKAQPVNKVDKKLQQFLSELGATLKNTRKPRGVGLAAPQVNKKWRIFTTFLEAAAGQPAQLRAFINPRITDHSDKLTFGPDPKEPRLEGCLSIPGIYGAVPRWQWVELAYDEINQDDASPNQPYGELIERRDHFADFAARVMLHEFDHLEGILFTDYSLKYDLPVYQENTKTKQFEEIEMEILQHL
jgi:peptide deformylase